MVLRDKDVVGDCAFKQTQSLCSGAMAAFIIVHSGQFESLSHIVKAL